MRDESDAYESAYKSGHAAGRLEGFVWGGIAMAGALTVMALLFGGAAASAQETTQTSQSGAAAVVMFGGSEGTDLGRSVPDAIAPGIIPAHPCAVAYSGGVSGAGFGVSLGASHVDRMCQGANLAAVAAQIGMVEEAQNIMRIAMDEWVREGGDQPVAVRDTRRGMEGLK